MTTNTKNEKVSAHKKGTYLEDAVRLIEQAILNSKPGLKDFPFYIETRKLIVSEGVRHEIDVYVEIDLGTGYNSVFIFECKNWKDPVGKNEIIIFSEKLKVANAQKGYFVAKKFTKYATNQSGKDKRIELIEVSADNIALFSSIDLHSIESDMSKVFPTANFITRGASKSGKNAVPFQADNCELILKGKNKAVVTFLFEQAKKIIDEKLKYEPTNKLPVGVYDYEYNEELLFEPNDLILDDKDIERVDLNIKFPLRVSRPKIRYSFEVGERGKVVSYDDVTSKGHRIGIALVQT